MDRFTLDDSTFEVVPQSSESLIPEESTDNRFKVEINIGLALPFKYYIANDEEKIKENKAVVRSVDGDGSVYMLEVKTQSNQGPLGAFENDVLLALLTMAWEQRDRNKS